MINAELIAKIKSEIERLKKDNEISEDEDYAQYEFDVACGYDMACDDILSFISTLESEKRNQDKLEVEIERYIPTSPAVKFPTTDIETIKSDIRHIARRFAKWGAEHLKK